MDNPNLPQEKLTKNLLPKSETRPATIRLRPAVNVFGIVLLVSGAVGILSHGLGILSIFAAGFGILTLLTNGLLKRSEDVFGSNFGQLESQKEREFKDLKHYISKTQYLENVGDLGEKTAAQFLQISERYKKFQDLLPQKFDPGEITFDRYQATAEQTFSSVVDHLKLVASCLNNISAIDPKYTEEQIKKVKPNSDQGSEELKNLDSRQALREQQIKTVNELLAFNEKAITEFDRLSTALSEVITSRSQTNADLETAMAQLKELADRAKKYSVS